MHFFHSRISSKLGHSFVILLIVLLLHLIALRFFAIHIATPNTQEMRIAIKLLPAKPVHLLNARHTTSHTASHTATHKRHPKSNSDDITATLSNWALQTLPYANQPHHMDDATLFDSNSTLSQLISPKAVNKEYGEDKSNQLLPDNHIESPDHTLPPEGEPFSLPPSMQTTYAAYVNGVRNQTGNIEWYTDGLHYRLQIAISLLFVGTITYSSEGMIDAYGLAPVRYEEARGKRAPVATNFNRDDRQTISFSRVTHTFPLHPGSQDRFSVLWQLVALVRGAPQQVAPGMTRVFYVADTDTVEEWRIQALEEDDIPAQGETGKWFRSRHFLRLPRRDGDARKLEVWLAESLGWIPVKIRQTEPNGNVLELLLLKSTIQQ